MTRLKATAAGAAAALLLAAAAPAFAGETLVPSGMLIADLGHDVDAIANAPHTDARIVEAADPEMPAFEQLAGSGGLVRVTIDLSAGGKVTRAWIASSSGRPRLDASALRATRHSRYAPATVGGRPVSGEYDVMVSFDPEN